MTKFEQAVQEARNLFFAKGSIQVDRGQEETSHYSFSDAALEVAHNLSAGVVGQICEELVTDHKDVMDDGWYEYAGNVEDPSFGLAIREMVGAAIMSAHRLDPDIVEEAQRLDVLDEHGAARISARKGGRQN